MHQILKTLNQNNLRDVARVARARKDLTMRAKNCANSLRERVLRARARKSCAITPLDGCICPCVAYMLKKLLIRGKI